LVAVDVNLHPGLCWYNRLLELLSPIQAQADRLTQQDEMLLIQVVSEQVGNRGEKKCQKKTAREK